MIVKIAAMILLILNLNGCGNVYSDFGKFNWWMKIFVKDVIVVVYDRIEKMEFIAGEFKTDFKRDAESVWETCRKVAHQYASQSNLDDWEYHCCGKTFWSNCVRI